eukprot:TRINITY_DN4110_c1_g1_i1.p1 TRINITY_DN4110_c1_g1~~TRINITY_DN4110_c1_g1_i1.p1  ORF type:complete len:117 (+),score=19.41 TRINITY_DN4110_c1_g1_i1:37-351(+)
MSLSDDPLRSLDRVNCLIKVIKHLSSQSSSSSSKSSAQPSESIANLIQEENITSTQQARDLFLATAMDLIVNHVQFACNHEIDLLVWKWGFYRVIETYRKKLRK